MLDRVSYDITYSGKRVYQHIRRDGVKDGSFPCGWGGAGVHSAIGRRTQDCHIRLEA